MCYRYVPVCNGWAVADSSVQQCLKHLMLLYQQCYIAGNPCIAWYQTATCMVGAWQRQRQDDFPGLHTADQEHSHALRLD